MRSRPVNRRATPRPRRGARRGPSPIAADGTILLSLLGFAGCASPRTDGEATRDPEEHADPTRPIAEVLADSTPAWMARSGVTGTALGRCGERACIVIYAADRRAGRGFPSVVEGHPLEIRVIGTPRALGDSS